MATVKKPAKPMPRVRERKRYYTEPLGSKVPALEQNVLKLRGMNLLLALFYAEDLKETAVNLVQGTDRLNHKINVANAPRVFPGVKNPVDKALTALVEDGAITADEKKEIVELIDYRNFIGHQLHNLLSDVGGTWAHRHGEYRPANLPKYDESAVKRLRHFRKRFGEFRNYVFTLTFAPLEFEAAEKTYLVEIERLQRKITRLARVRRNQIKSVNAELQLAGTGLEGDASPGHPAMRYWRGAHDGRLTKRGVETVYKLFDLGKSPMAVAHLTGLSIEAVRKRRKMWKQRKGAPPKGKR